MKDITYLHCLIKEDFDFDEARKIFKDNNIEIGIFHRGHYMYKVPTFQTHTTEVNKADLIRTFPCVSEVKVIHDKTWKRFRDYVERLEGESYDDWDKRGKDYVVARIRKLADHIEKDDEYPYVLDIEIPEKEIGENEIRERWEISLAFPLGG